MSSASLGAADCGKRLSIADEEVVQAARQTRGRNEICLDGREKDGCTNRPRVLYHIIFVVFFPKK